MDAACDATTPAQPPAPGNTSTGFTELDVYRIQAATWVANISNADAADCGGLSCFIERNAPQWLPAVSYPQEADLATAAMSAYLIGFE